MSPRAKSWLGGLLFAVGLLSFFGGALFPGLVWIAWTGAALAVAGLAFVVSALLNVSREIGGNQARFEAQLRAGVDPSISEKKDEEEAS